jgi:hypothetical protein
MVTDLALLLATLSIMTGALVITGVPTKLGSLLVEAAGPLNMSMMAGYQLGSFRRVRVRVADGPAQWIRDKGQQHLPGDEAWLIGAPQACDRQSGRHAG